MKKKRGVLFMVLGSVLLLSAMTLLIYNNWQESNAKKSAGEIFEKLNNEIAHNSEEQHGSEKQGNTDTISIENNKYIGIISIPILDLKLPVLSQWSYPSLKVNPCRYKGNLYDNSLILLAHNYKSHFGTIKRLRSGDKISIVDVYGNPYNYVVTDVTELGGTDVEEMESGEWDLTLFTCTYGGKSRVTVRCIRTS